MVNGSEAFSEGLDPSEVAALDRLANDDTWAVDGVVLTVTNLDKVLFPATEDRPEATKRDLLRYLAHVCGFMLPYFAGRPANLVRHPNGTHAPGFWAKAAPKRGKHSSRAYSSFLTPSP